jgi:hypothetical protein
MLRRASFVGLLATTLLVSVGQGQTDSSTRISLQERVYVAFRVHSTILGYFDGQQDTNMADFDKSYVRETPMNIREVRRW